MAKNNVGTLVLAVFCDACCEVTRISAPKNRKPVIGSSVHGCVCDPCGEKFSNDEALLELWKRLMAQVEDSPDQLEAFDEMRHAAWGALAPFGDRFTSTTPVSHNHQEVPSDC